MPRTSVVTNDVKQLTATANARPQTFSQPKPAAQVQQTFGNQAVLRASKVKAPAFDGGPAATLPFAAPWTPDHQFYELLAHEIAYLKYLDGGYFYRPEDKPSAQTPSNEARLASGLFGFTWLPDGYALASAPPPVRIPSLALFYKVELTEDKATDLQFYTLVPNLNTAPRILVFRGTEGTIGDLRADADALGVAHDLYFLKDRVKIDEGIVKLLNGPGRGLVITGHSLGGAIAQLTTANSPFAGSITETVTFNSPGINKKDAAKFAPGSGTKVSHYVTRGDVVSTAGVTFLPGTVTVLDGPATKELETLVGGNEIVDAQSAFDALPLFLDSIIVIELIPFALARIEALLTDILLFLAVHGDGIAALVHIGELAKELHGGHYLAGARAEAPAKEATGPKTSAAKVSASKAPAPKYKATLNPAGTTVSAPANEAGRVALSPSVMAALPILFLMLEPLIESLIANPKTAVLRELIGDRPLLQIAVKLKPLVDALVKEVDKVGGLKPLFERALNR
jgi:hypothetical protein